MKTRIETKKYFKKSLIFQQYFEYTPWNSFINQEKNLRGKIS